LDTLPTGKGGFARRGHLVVQRKPIKKGNSGTEDPCDGNEIEKAFKVIDGPQG